MVGQLVGLVGRDQNDSWEIASAASQTILQLRKRGRFANFYYFDQVDMNSEKLLVSLLAMIYHISTWKKAKSWALRLHSSRTEQFDKKQCWRLINYKDIYPTMPSHTYPSHEVSEMYLYRYRQKRSQEMTQNTPTSQ